MARPSPHDYRLSNTDPRLDEIRQSIPHDKPDWTENVAWWLNDPASCFAMYAHLGRMQPDRKIWEGLSLLNLPDGGLLVNRSLGASVAEARNREYDYKPIVPLKLWRFKFDGCMQRVDPQALRAQPVADEPFERVFYDLTFEAMQPVFNMHESTMESDRMHLEQGGRIVGSITVGDERFDIECFGYRDHSMKERTFSTLDSETWSNCVFPSGRTFSLLHVRRGNKQIMEGQVYTGQRIEIAHPEAFPSLEDSAGAPYQGRIRLKSVSGLHEIEWEIADRRFAPLQLLRPVGMRPGIRHDLPDQLAVVECPATFTWNGEVGHGWIERARPLNALGA